MNVINYIIDILYKFRDFASNLMNITISDVFESVKMPFNVPVVTDLWNGALNGIINFMNKYGASDYPALLGILSFVLLSMLVVGLIKLILSFVK